MWCFCKFGKNQAMHRKILAAGIFCVFGIFTGTGQEFPTLGEIYDFEPGDVFETAHYFCCNDVYFQVERQEIEEKIFFDNNYGYLIKLSQFNLLWEDPQKIIDTSLWQEPDTLWISYPDSVIFRSGDTVIQNPDFYHGRKIYIRTFYLLNALCEERYVKGCGMVYKGWGTPPSTTTSPQDSLTWYCTTNECWGNSMLTLRISDLPLQFLIHPNPATRTITISKTRPMAIRSIRMIDMNGGTIRYLEDYYTLNYFKINLSVEELVSGIYFLHIDTDRGPFVYKFVKLWEPDYPLLQENFIPLTNMN
jgi:hypothetical protein